MLTNLSKPDKMSSRRESVLAIIFALQALLSMGWSQVVLVSLWVGAMKLMYLCHGMPIRTIAQRNWRASHMILFNTLIESSSMSFWKSLI